MLVERIDSGINGNHLILENDVDSNVGYKARMLSENRIPDYLECGIIQSDGREQYVYDTTSKISLRDLYEYEEMDYRFLCCLINGMASGLERAQEYLLPPEHIFFDPGHIYVDTEHERIYWCYYPGSYTSLKEGMNELAEYILTKADHKDSRATTLAYGLYKQICNEDYTLRRLVSESAGYVQDEMNENESEEDYRIADDKDLFLPSKDDAPQLPVPGKVISGVCILVLLAVSGLTLAGVIYDNASLNTLLAMREMQVLLGLTGAMAILLPLLIILKWYNRFREFKRNLREAADQKDDVYMRLSLSEG